MSEAIVVGSGPNGLAAAATLAARGVGVTVIEAASRIGGGARTSELTLPGLLHDDCSASHPFSPGSRALAPLGLERHGLEWAWAEIDLAHPFDDGSAATMQRSIEATAAGLGRAGAAWKRLFGSSSTHFDALSEDIMRPVARLPRHPLALARFAPSAAAPVSLLARALPTERARALFGGTAAHSFSPFSRPFSAAAGMALTCACHSNGWPVARGGSGAIAAALAVSLREHGGRIETGRPLRSLAELPAVDAVIFDLAPAAVAEIAADRLPSRTVRAYRRYRHGPAAFKVDLAVAGGVPWAAEAAGRAGTVHAIGSYEETVVSEREINRGRMPERPFVLVGQQYLADPSRSRGDVHPLWAYAHVPHGYTGDATEALLDQIERFAPGLRERILARHVRSPAELASYNPNYVGGDIVTGANTPLQSVFRPRIALDPYSTGAPGLFICSAATPPSAGAHGMNGFNAAQSVLRHLRRLT
ncbi:MAG TPA: NAD(P)/FAD-dependent oxidoreductase [Solirubrobacterales bacterium]|nr:NAD(P)/FAD-dependent oxidoreductase [Solirubrobacterales bacterium]